MDQLPQVDISGIQHYMVKDVFKMLNVSAYRRQIESLSEGDYNKEWKAVTLRGLLKIVFSSRVEGAVEVQDRIITHLLGGKKALPTPLVEVQPVAKAMPVQEEPRPLIELYRAPPMVMSKKVFDMLDTLDCYVGQVRGLKAALVSIRAEIARHGEKYEMPEWAWLNYQIDQVSGYLPEEARDDQFLEDQLVEFSALRTKEDWEAAETLR